MNNLHKLPVECLVGNLSGSQHFLPLIPYAPLVIDFLADLSKRLFSNQTTREYPDIASFAYWCRRANITRISKSWDKKSFRVGRGTVLHIAPSNVPVNFAFSLAFGLLAGNANIVRISTEKHDQALIICAEIKSLIEKPEYIKISGMIKIISFQRNDAITLALSKSCDARVLWGGNATINHLKTMPTSPRCVDISFADRYSLCILSAQAIVVANKKSLDRLVSGFYNDVFLLDQNACSSPHLVLWQGEEKEICLAMKRFWTTLNMFISLKSAPPTIHFVDKYTHLCSNAIKLSHHAPKSSERSYVYRTLMTSIPEDIASFRGRYGYFFEAVDNDFKKFQVIVGKQYQTITYYGVNPDSIIDVINACGLRGIDRIVPVGKALDIGVMWDGYDIVGTLSRVINVE